MHPLTIVLLVIVALILLGALAGKRAEHRRAVVERLAAPMSLRDAARPLGVSLEVLRRASSRDPRFPRPVRPGSHGAHLYDLAALQAWARARPGRPRGLQRGLDRARGMTADYE